VLGLDGDAIQIPLGIAPLRLPEILSRQAIARPFAAITRMGVAPFRS
jgi:hypothetical protein